MDFVVVETEQFFFFFETVKPSSLIMSSGFLKYSASRLV